MKFTKTQEAIIKRMMKEQCFYTFRTSEQFHDYEQKEYYVLTDRFKVMFFNEKPDCLEWDKNKGIESVVKGIESKYINAEKEHCLSRVDIDANRIKNYIKAKEYTRHSNNPFIVLTPCIVFNAFYFLDCLEMVKADYINLFSIPGGYAMHCHNSKSHNFAILLPIKVHYGNREEFYQSKFIEEKDLRTWTVYHE